MQLNRLGARGWEVSWAEDSSRAACCLTAEERPNPAAPVCSIRSVERVILSAVPPSSARPGAWSRAGRDDRHGTCATLRWEQHPEELLSNACKR